MLNVTVQRATPIPAPEPPIEKVTLVLDAVHAQWLRQLTYQWSRGVGVNPGKEGARALNEVHRSLAQAGVPFPAEYKDPNKE